MRWPRFSPPTLFIPAACLREGHEWCRVCREVTRFEVHHPRETVGIVRRGLSCMGWLRAPVCYLDDYLHRWFPWTYSGHWADRVDQPVEPFVCRLHNRMQERYARKKWPDLFEEEIA